MNKRVVMVVIAVLLVGGAIVAYIGSRNNDSTSGQATGPTASQSDNEQAQATDKVDISGFAFTPKAITVKAGTTVTWTNKDPTEHNVVAYAESDFAPKSELLSQGESYSFTFEKTGTYKYHCEPHPNMQGTVVVTE